MLIIFRENIIFMYIFFLQFLTNQNCIFFCMVENVAYNLAGTDQYRRSRPNIDGHFHSAGIGHRLPAAHIMYKLSDYSCHGISRDFCGHSIFS